MNDRKNIKLSDLKVSFFYGHLLDGGSPAPTFILRDNRAFCKYVCPQDVLDTTFALDITSFERLNIHS